MPGENTRSNTDIPGLVRLQFDSNVGGKFRMMVGAAQRSRGYRIIPHLELHGRCWPGGGQDGHSQHAPSHHTDGTE